MSARRGTAARASARKQGARTYKHVMQRLSCSGTVVSAPHGGSGSAPSSRPWLDLPPWGTPQAHVTTARGRPRAGNPTATRPAQRTCAERGPRRAARARPRARARPPRPRARPPPRAPTSRCGRRRTALAGGLAHGGRPPFQGTGRVTRPNRVTLFCRLADGRTAQPGQRARFCSASQHHRPGSRRQACPAARRVQRHRGVRCLGGRRARGGPWGPACGGWRTRPVRLQQLLGVAPPAQRERPRGHRPAAQAAQLHPQARAGRPPACERASLFPLPLWRRAGPHPAGLAAARRATSWNTRVSHGRRRLPRGGCSWAPVIPGNMSSPYPTRKNSGALAGSSVCIVHQAPAPAEAGAPRHGRTGAKRPALAYVFHVPLHCCALGALHPTLTLP